jgi:hypothetical protein
MFRPTPLSPPRFSLGLLRRGFLWVGFLWVAIYGGFLRSLPLFGQPQLARYGLAFELSKHDFADTIAIDYDQERVFLPVVINGERKRFLLDTGSGQAVVYDDAPIEGCRPAGHIISHDATGRRDTVQMLTLPPINIGSLTLTGCQATLQHRAVRRQNIDGIIGFDLVCKGPAMKIDVRNRQLVLTDRKKFFDSEPGFDTRYRLNYHVPYLDIYPFTGYKDRVLFDTGSRRLYAINRNRFDEAERYCLRQNPRQIEGRSTGHYAMGFHGTEALGEVVFLALDSLRWGKFSFCDLHTLTTQGGSHIGAKVLEYGAVVFNPRRKRVRFQPYDAATRAVIANPQLEKAIVNVGGRPVVGLVWERSEAYRAGLRQGDVIEQVDGQPLRSFSEYLLFRPLRGRLYTFTVVDRRGFRKQVTMTF